MVIKWINKNMSWFFTNGNKQSIDVRNKHFPYLLSEDEENDTVTIIMPKQNFVASMKFMKYGFDCFKYKCLPQWEPKMTTARQIEGVVEGITCEAREIGRRFYIKTKKQRNEA